MSLRNNELLNARNKRIHERYKELYNINFLRNEKVLEILSQEFYISPKTIQKIIIGQKKNNVVES